MNSTKAATHPLNEFDMWQLLDFKGSFQLSKQLLCTYCTKWRENRKEQNPKAGKHGGVTANARDLVRAILRILPPSMEWIREHRQSVFKKCLSSGLFAIVTTSTALRKQMAQRSDGDETEENDMVSRSTVFETLKTLEAAGIIFARKAVCNPNDADKKAMLIYINPAALSLYSPSATLPDFAEAVTDDINENNAMSAPFAQNGIVQFSDYNNTLIRSLENKDNTRTAVENVLPTGNESQKAELVRSTESKDPVRPFQKVPAAPANCTTSGAILWKTCKGLLYEERNFELSTIAQAEQLLEAHCEAAKEYIAQLRTDSIAAFCKTKKYLDKPEKGRPALLKWFVDKSMPAFLRNVELTAISVVMEALRMQAQAANKYGFKTYYPTVFLSQDYGLEKYLKMVKSDLIVETSSPIAERCAEIRVKTALRSLVSAFTMTVQKHGVGFAAQQADGYVERAAAIIKKEESIETEDKKTFYNYFKKQIISLLK